MTGEVFTAVASTAAEQSVSRVERRSAREDRKRRQFEEETAQVASISVLRSLFTALKIVSVNLSPFIQRTKSVQEHV